VTARPDLADRDQRVSGAALQFKNQNSFAANKDERFLFDLAKRFHRITRSTTTSGRNPVGPVGLGLVGPQGRRARRTTRCCAAQGRLPCPEHPRIRRAVAAGGGGPLLKHQRIIGRRRAATVAPGRPGRPAGASSRPSSSGGDTAMVRRLRDSRWPIACRVRVTAALRRPRTARSPSGSANPRCLSHRQRRAARTVDRRMSLIPTVTLVRGRRSAASGRTRTRSAA